MDGKQEGLNDMCLLANACFLEAMLSFKGDPSSEELMTGKAARGPLATDVDQAKKSP